MSKNPEQLLVIDPESDLKFRGPFTTSVTSYMKITNPTAEKILFKIKTTAPKKYCVRPNSGILEPDQTVEIAVSLQPFDFDPTEKCKHKFMVQSVVASDGDIKPDDMFRNASPETLMNSKLRCVFEMPDEHPTVVSPEETYQSPMSAQSDIAEPARDNLSNEEREFKEAEIKSLQEELFLMQKENVALKEEIRQASINGMYPQTPTAGGRMELRTENTFLPIVFLVAGILIGLLAVMVGRHVF